jgi:hypothetical protein
MLPIFALISVFLESLGSLHIFAILGTTLTVGGSRRGMVPAFLNFQTTSGEGKLVVDKQRLEAHQHIHLSQTALT